LKGIGKSEGLDETDPFSAAHCLSVETETEIPSQVKALETLPVIHKDVIAAEEMAQNIKKTLGIMQ
jgi:threonine synthase